MSTKRTSRNAGFVAPSHLPKGPNGRALCRQCGTEVPKGRRTFCSEPCVDAWRIKRDPSHARRLVFRRDRGVCALCGLDTEAVKPKARFEAPRMQKWFRENHEDYGDHVSRTTGRIYEAEASRRRQVALDAYYRERDEAARILAERGFPVGCQKGYRSLWDADHIVPVVEGGGECELDNYRTLCVPCHQRVTAELAARLAERRRAEKAAGEPTIADLPLFRKVTP